MTEQGLREQINRMDVREIVNLDPDECEKGYICPKCHSGRGDGHGQGKKSGKGTGLHYYPDTNKLHCFNCGTTYDPLELLRVDECGGDYYEALKAAANRLSIPWESVELEHGRGTRVSKTPSTYRRENPRQTSPASTQSTKPDEPIPDYTDYLKRTQAALTDESAGAAYLRSRGLDLDTARSLGIGYDPTWRHPSVPDTVPTSPRIIAPMDTGTYEARDIRSDAELERIGGSALKYKKQSVAPKGMFNTAALRQADPVYIVEGWADAVAVESAGGHAVALNSASQVGKLTDMLASLLEQGSAIPPLILQLDPDKTGKDKQAELTSWLDERGLRHIDGNVCVPDTNTPAMKLDPAASFLCDRDMFAFSVREDMDAARNAQAPSPTCINEPPSQTNGQERANLAAELRLLNYRDTYDAHTASGAQRHIPTGFPVLDDMLDGGWHPGLFVLGGVTGCGKSTFVLQCCDYLAEHGHPVLYAALEMSRDELISKSISRLNAEMTGNAIKWSRILDGQYNARQARERYFDTIAPNMYVMESVASDTAQDFYNNACSLAQGLGRSPICVLDYIQILEPLPKARTERQAVDMSAKLCKLVSRTLATPVIAITSYSRENYNLGPGATDGDWMRTVLQAAKESGCVEYTSDAVLGFGKIGQYIKGKPREMTLYRPKNRRGDPERYGKFLFYGATSRFECADIRSYDGQLPTEWSGEPQKDRNADKPQQLAMPTDSIVVVTRQMIEKMDAPTAKDFYIGVTAPAYRPALRQLSAKHAKADLLGKFEGDSLGFKVYDDTPIPGGAQIRLQ